MAIKIDPKKIRIDCDTQARVEVNEAVIAEYAEAMERGDEFPPIQVFFLEASDEFVVADGFFRYFAHMQVRPNDPILAEVLIGTVEDARWASFAANKTHGWPRTNADKRNAVRRALLHPSGAGSTDRHIAKHIGVDHKTVAPIRLELQLSGEIPQIETRTVQRGNQTYQQKTSQIGKKGESHASCIHCLNFMATGGECMLDSSLRTPWTEACEEYEAIPPEPERREKIPDIPKEYEEVDLNKKPRKKHTTRYKPRNTVCIDVPIDNPQLAVIELRARLGEEYLEQCFIVLRTMLCSPRDDDPFTR